MMTFSLHAQIDGTKNDCNIKEKKTKKKEKRVIEKICHFTPGCLLRCPWIKFYCTVLSLTLHFSFTSIFSHPLSFSSRYSSKTDRGRKKLWLCQHPSMASKSTPNVRAKATVSLSRHTWEREREREKEREREREIERKGEKVEEKQSKPLQSKLSHESVHSSHLEKGFNL